MVVKAACISLTPSETPLLQVATWRLLLSSSRGVCNQDFRINYIRQEQTALCYRMETDILAVVFSWASQLSLLRTAFTEKLK